MERKGDNLLELMRGGLIDRNFYGVVCRLLTYPVTRACVNVHHESLTAMNGSVASFFNIILLNYFWRWFFRVYGLLGENFRSTDFDVDDQAHPSSSAEQQK